MLVLLRAILLGFVLSGITRERPRERRASQAQVIREHDDDLAKRIEIHNHLYQVKRGDRYRCQFCGRESLALLWPDMYTCPLCKRMYDWMSAQDDEE